MDGLVWDVVTVSIVSAGIGRGFNLSYRGKYFRVLYKNGWAAQIQFRLDVTHRPATNGIITRPLDDTLNTENFAQTVRAVTDAQKPDTTFGHLQTDVSGNLKTLVSGTVQGFTAADLPGNYYPILIGAISEIAGDTQPANLVDAEGDIVRISAGRDGALYVKPHPTRIWHYAQEFTTAQTNYVIKSGVSNLSLYLNTITFSTNNATIIGTLLDGTTINKWRYYASGTANLFNQNYNPPIKLASGSNLNFTSTGTGTCKIKI